MKPTDFSRTIYVDEEHYVDETWMDTSIITDNDDIEVADDGLLEAEYKLVAVRKLNKSAIMVEVPLKETKKKK